MRTPQLLRTISILLLSILLLNLIYHDRQNKYIFQHQIQHRLDSTNRADSIWYQQDIVLMPSPNP
ncbi:hypothetical protein [Spirosoma harenae]